nr:hypothetical protein [uncultured Mediterranean phage uvMED]
MVLRCTTRRLNSWYTGGTPGTPWSHSYNLHATNRVPADIISISDDSNHLNDDSSGTHLPEVFK